jgi:hypothetical protein
MYGTEFPPCLFEQVTEISDRAFLAIEEAHHLWWERKKKSAQLSPYWGSTSFSYLHIDKVHP